METRAHHVVIGLFLVVFVAGALLFGLWLAKNHTDAGVAQFDVEFNEAVNGLSEGSAVMYSGIKVGDVARLRLDPADPRKVVARIRIASSVPIRQDTVARLRLTGVTGTSVIQLSSGRPDSPLLVGTGDQAPVIVATPSPISQLLAGGEDLMLNVSELVASSRRMMSPHNAEQLGRILDNLEKTTQAMADGRDDVARLSAQVAVLGQQAAEVLSRTSSLLGRTDALVADQGRQTLQGAQAAMTSLARAGDSIDRLVQENRGALGSGAQGLNELGGALRELRTTLASLRAVMRRLEDNPANYLLGREQPKEFTP
ncbi:mce related protein [Pigmentiphaga humi]|uniref:Mce related protein n=1 Tax=Pigmentiphaga humi TaxID=2478468 RepID=A0A3P4B0W8_9BURK|nr:MlaD family protein [Pigmentiphaga humi]VCU69491.1 mce related protein [Pigmentiphaga humi]